MDIAVAAAVELILLHMIDGRVVQVNPGQVTQLISSMPTTDKPKALPDAVQCVVRLVDGTFVSVAEDCDTVRDMMSGP